MGRTRKLLSLLLTMALLLGTLCLTASAAELTPEAAFAYLEQYADNVSTDPDFSDNVENAIETAQTANGSYATIVSLLPPVIAIILGLLTRQIYLSLAAGVLSGALIYANFNPWKAALCTFDNMNGILCNRWNVDILVFLMLLGNLVNLINKSGGVRTYSRWVEKRIKNKRQALLAASVLGMLNFIDDRFSCMTLGAITRSVTDKFRISREKLAYIIDATAAPVCVLVPFSSWLAAISGAVPEGQGVFLFLRAIPYNLYAILTLFMVIATAYMGLDFGKMRKAEENALRGYGYPVEEIAREEGNSAGTIWDMILPMAALVLSCFGTMVYSGGFFDAASATYRDFMGSLAACDATMGLVMGVFLALVLTSLLYLPRKIVTFQQFADSLLVGVQSMAAPILIQILAWALSGIATRLGADVYMAELVRHTAGGLACFLPAVIFLIAVGLSFSTGTSWGTFGVLLPMICALLPEGELLIISVSACLAGAVCGDHCSPISDTTIMSSAGADCDHINHVNTQMPYAMTVAAVSFVGYLLAGFVQSAWIVLPASIAMLFGVLQHIRQMQRKQA